MWSPANRTPCRVRCAALVLVLLFAHPPDAPAAPSNETDARIWGMGGAGITNAEGAISTYSNPALLGLLTDYDFTTTLPVIIPSGALLTSRTRREIGGAVPVTRPRHPLVVVGVNYQKDRSLGSFESSALSFSGGMSVTPWLAAGVAARRVSVDLGVEDSEGDAALSWDFGGLFHRELTRHGERSISGRAGLAYRNWGPELRLRAPGGAEGTFTLPEEYAVGLGLVLDDPFARLILAWEFSERVDDQAFIPRKRLYGAELQLLDLLSLRAGYSDIPGPDAVSSVQRGTTQGFGFRLPFPHRVVGKFDYAMDAAGNDLYALSVSVASPRDTARTWSEGRLRTRIGFGLGAAASEPYDHVTNGGISLQVGALLRLMTELEMENHLGLTILRSGDQFKDYDYSVIDFGTGLRHRFDFGKVSPFASGGVRGYRVGASTEAEQGGERRTLRGQDTSAGYYIGLGVEIRPDDPGWPASEIGVRVHSIGTESDTRNLTSIDVAYALLFR